MLFKLFSPVSAFAENKKLYIGGMPAGFIIDSKGALIIGVNDVISKDGLFSPSIDAGIREGDVLISLDGKQIDKANDIEDVLSCYDGNGITAVIERKSEVLIKIVYPAKDINGKYRLGMFICDDITGIGTVTYIDESGSFGALGHPVVDGNQKAVKINSGEVFGCCITGVVKGERGRAGELRGFFTDDKSVGIIEKNTQQGIFGRLNDFDNEGLELVESGKPKQGKAYIYSTVEGCSPKKYVISIVKFDERAKDNKNLVIKITDEELLNETNGILQGMSGSPIVQNGKLVGAVTHVFINDPTTGYGIAIDNMLSAA